MESERQIGTVLIIVGVLVAGAGLVLLLFGKIPLLGRLPGDLAFRRGNFRLSIPITTSVILSALVTLILWAIEFLKRK